MDKQYNPALSGLGRKLAAELKEQTTCGTTGPDVYGGAACRQSGKGYLLDKARRSLRALADAIPDNFPADADEGLWNLVSKSH